MLERYDFTFSAGVTAFQTGESRAEFILRSSDALEQAKREGKKQIRGIAAGFDTDAVISF
jgi:PleD family two-component response regulator